MRTTLLSVLLVTAPLIAGCGLFEPTRTARSPMEDVHHLRAGMSADTLRERIGAPDSVRDEPDGSERWTYVYGDHDRSVTGRPMLVVHVRDDEVKTWEER